MFPAALLLPAHGTLLAADSEIRRGRAAVSLAELKLVIRSTMSVVLTDPSCVRSHRSLPGRRTGRSAPALLGP
ncbi:hypothetical protein [Streptomyces sp.]|uniref:hypothetical protein n=1 Tax=Streptomyces sp. TaxID=1931 RepID=UPI002D79BC2B|nr:hypothetical protein [Streptomyces sp.]HET6355936.1 hypothetical protein [Streptomyces sp.]